MCALDTQSDSFPVLPLLAFFLRTTTRDVKIYILSGDLSCTLSTPPLLWR